MGSSLAVHLQDKLTGDPPPPVGWFTKRFTRTARFLGRLVGRKHHVLGTFEAVGFPVGNPQRLSDGSLAFELFVFDIAADGQPFETPVGVRANCLLPRRAYDPAEDISPNEELNVAGEVVWMSELGGYVLRIEGLQVLQR